MKKIISLVLALVMILSLAACAKTKTETKKEAVGYEENVIIGTGALVDTPDPYGSTGAECQMYSNMTHLMLAYNNSDTGKLDPIMAESWKDLDGDGLHWEVVLKKGITFHNGVELTAEDVKFTWEYASSDAGNCVKPLSAATYVESYDIKDDYTIVFNLKSAMFDFPTYLDTKIYCKEAFDTMDVEEAVKIGTGPYYYDEDLYQAGAQCGYTRYDDFYEGLDKYPTKHFIVKAIPEEDARNAALQAGEIDISFFTSSSFLRVLEEDTNVKTYTRPGAQSYYVGWNWYSKPVNDIKLRQAIAMAINKEDIISVAFEDGLGGSASDNFCVPTGLGYKDIEGIKYDPEKAKSLLKELGYDKGLTLKLVHYPDNKKIAEVMQANLKEVGITLDVQQVDGTNWSAFKSAHDGFDIFLDYCSYKGALLYNYNRFFQQNGSSNATGYYNQEFEDLLNNVLTAPDYDSMVKEFGTMQEWVSKDVTVIPLAINNMVGATRADVEGYVLADTANWMDFSTAYIPQR